MLKITGIAGYASDPSISEQLHALKHQNRVDYLTIDVADTARKRLSGLTDNGRELAVVLPRSQTLDDGAVLLLNSDMAIVVRTNEQEWLRLQPRDLPDALELGYHAGNLHWEVRFEAGDLLVALSGPAEDYLARIEPLISGGRVTQR